MAQRKPKTEKAHLIESTFFRSLRRKFDDRLGPGFYTKREILDFMDEFYRCNIF